MPPLCFVLMPFGLKTDGNKKEIDFDKVYHSFIKEAVIAAGLEPIRADEEKTGGFIHKPMYERLMFCDFAVADLSFANANVFYELGIRHALKPFTTVSIFEVNTKLPFDTAPLRTFPYDYENGLVIDVQNKIIALSELIKVNLDVQKAQQDSPIAQLITGYKFPDLQYLQEDADAFAENAINLRDKKRSLTALVKQWADHNKIAEKIQRETNQASVIDSIIKLQQEEGHGLQYNYDFLYSLIAAYKSVNAFSQVVKMLTPLVNGRFKNNIFVKQQLALAFNKVGQREDAENILRTITDQYGPDPETSGLLGAVYKGLADDNKDNEDDAAEYNRQAIKAYVEGFEADPRNFYPGVNALTLMFLGESKDESFDKFMPLVKYAVERDLRIKAKDYWVQATALELAVLDMNETDSRRFASAAVACKPENWMKETTANNLKKIYLKALQSKEEQHLQWLKDIIIKLDSTKFILSTLPSPGA